MSAADKLLADPLAFLKRHCVWPVDPPDIWGTLQNQVLDPSTITDAGYKVVDKTRPVCYGELVKGGDFHTAGGAYLMKVSMGNKLTGSEKLARVPIWYLAWKSGYMTEFTIPPARPTPRGKDIPGPWTTGNRVPGTGADLDPYLFFTTGIAGCSVFVSGSLYSPTVNHAGQDGWNATKKAEDHWRDMFERRHPDAFQHDAYTEIEKKHYVVNMSVQAPHPNIPGHVNTVKSTVHTERYLKFAADRQRTQGIEILDGQPYGCVFGVRDKDRTWSFYLQENVRVTYKLPSGLTQTAQRPMIVTQIFPGRGFSYVARFEDTKPLKLG